MIVSDLVTPCKNVQYRVETVERSVVRLADSQNLANKLPAFAPLTTLRQGFLFCKDSVNLPSFIRSPFTMPKEATTSRNPMVPPQRAVRRSTGTQRSLAQPIGTLPGSEGGGHGPTSQRPLNIQAVPVCHYCHSYGAYILTRIFFARDGLPTYLEPRIKTTRMKTLRSNTLIVKSTSRMPMRSTDS